MNGRKSYSLKKDFHYWDVELLIKYQHYHHDQSEPCEQNYILICLWKQQYLSNLYEYCITMAGTFI